MTKTLRTRRLFGPDRRALVVALDRPRALFTPGLREIEGVIRASSTGGADAVIVSPGTAVKHQEGFGTLGVILSVRGDRTTVAVRLEEAVRLGVDCLKYEAFPDAPASESTIEVLDFLGARCDALGMPLLAEMVPHSFEATERHTSAAVAHAARVGQECGADFVKVPFPTDGRIDEVVDYASVPVLVLGGPAKDSTALAATVEAAVAAGAVGAAVGRNVFDAPDPSLAISSLAAAVHGTKSPER